MLTAIRILPRSVLLLAMTCEADQSEGFDCNKNTHRPSNGFLKHAHSTPSFLPCIPCARFDTSQQCSPVGARTTGANASWPVSLPAWRILGHPAMPSLVLRRQAAHRSSPEHADHSIDNRLPWLAQIRIPRDEYWFSQSQPPAPGELQSGSMPSAITSGKSKKKAMPSPSALTPPVPTTCIHRRASKSSTTHRVQDDRLLKPEPS
ncbi:hypothetical protein GE09DRAFT_708042 [Coniochaeta sp. 2T2.1]|nr:hypothetical protein GE09DRAFT_708042 [Coniochaeta sp. 2T2.1]